MHEFELNFLPKKELMPKLAGCSYKEMLDIYIPASVEHPFLRIRKRGDSYEITKKVPVHEGDASHQLETTIPLTAEEYAELSQIPGKRVAKNRYAYTEAGHEYEVDVFQGDLKGLVMVDIEFPSVTEKDAFILPPWAIVDVTQEKFLAGGMVCGKKYADIEAELDRFGYEKIL